MARYINPFVDFGFKYIFGREESKPFLIDFLNALLAEEPGFSPIVKLEYLDKEKSRVDREARGIIYDIHCESSNGKRFTVEMQNQPQAYFFDRIIYYASRAIVDQGRAGQDWKYQFLPVYCVSFMNFVMDGYSDRLRIDAAICDLKTKQPFSDKMRYIFIQTPLFDKKRPEDCESDFDKWMYNIINMHTMDTLAFTQQKNLFDKLEKWASYATLSREERMEYDADLKAYRDMTGQLEYAEAKGRAEGRAEGEQKGKRDIILAMAKEGFPIAQIARLSGIAIEKIQQIIGGK